MAEFGGTQNVVCQVVSTFGGTAAGGKQLLGSILSIIPGISSIVTMDFSKMSLESAMNSHAIGGTYIGDLLFDFGSPGLFWSAIILGIVFFEIYELYEKSIVRSNYFYVALLAPIIVDLIFCVRSSMAKMPRMTIWYLVLFLLLHLLLNRKVHSIPSRT